MTRLPYREIARANITDLKPNQTWCIGVPAGSQAKITQKQPRSAAHPGAGQPKKTPARCRGPECGGDGGHQVAQGHALHRPGNELLSSSRVGSVARVSRVVARESSRAASPPESLTGFRRADVARTDEAAGLHSVAKDSNSF